MAEPDLRPAVSTVELADAGERLSLPVAALAPALVEPMSRLLVDGAGSAVLLRRQWAGDGTAEAVVLHRTGVHLEHPAVQATAADWGCDRVCHSSTGRTVPVRSVAGASLVARFRRLAALAATRVEVAVALARDAGRERTKSNGSPVVAADEAAHAAAAEVLGELGVTLLSEERRDTPVDDGEPWIVLDPLDGTGNFSAGLPPWAFSAALVVAGRPVAGLVADLSSGRRWAAAEGDGAWRDGVPVRPRPGSTVVVPSAPGGRTVVVPTTARRIRVTGCTALDLCLVADGAAAAWHDVDRGGTYVHDVAGGLAVLLAAGGVALTPDGDPLRLRPDTATRIRFVAAPDEGAARELLTALGGQPV
ncbi:inositol monophosphatase family protein [Blastococcus sp. PRF04-17]|uniref:inositol monophosphatase family protein n=1 Tax=Blastococcus sp. PRF04-17 TaxID=2933797 RepID=UPI001FF6CB9D|nr:inositol monophosphatase family protein [Blastococcus sp. PRF04-17]UOX99819.1 inositol monophosphatase [Blastococcus sp. PRF04-17]